MSSPTSDRDFYKIFGYISLGNNYIGYFIAIISKVFASSITNDNYDDAIKHATEKACV